MDIFCSPDDSTEKKKKHVKRAVKTGGILFMCVIIHWQSNEFSVYIGRHK